MTLDFKSHKCLVEFYDSFDDKIVQLDDKILMKLHFVEFNGPTELDWYKAFYGESRVTSKRPCPLATLGSVTFVCSSPFPA